MNNDVPPCAGQWLLFDSVDLADHRRARAMCGVCPIRLECRKQLEEASADSHCGPKYGPRGTWAGMLVGLPRTSARRAQAEEAMFSEDEARTAHANFAAGFRDARTLVGERVYNRRKKRQQTARRAA